MRTSPVNPPSAKNSPAELAGRVAVVTGGGSGIGRAIALRYAAAGGTVAVLGRRPDALAETARLAGEYGGTVETASVDVRDADALTAAIDAVAARHGRLDALVNNAAGNFVVPAEDLSPNGWRAVVDIVLNGTFFATRAAAQHMLGAGDGAIVNVIASYAWHGHPGTVHSAAAKGGVLAMTRTLAAEWGARGVRVNCIAPGPTETEGAGAALWPTPEARARVLDSVPAGRLTTPDEVAEAALFLLEERSRYITGTTMVIDGGQWLGRQVYG
ncbi:SDR family oxidoreductase [Streptomyces sp. NBC_01089]|uniref:SDR family oxidoreductase n=1 Tax=Streptomyces sp. NBC_01089 TaxID=2903747 RepID=UPI00386C88E4|nr:SDR family oxidoreductase [Streptomyces sp. NBC_01089]